MEFITNLLKDEAIAKGVIGFLIASAIFIAFDFLKHRPTVLRLENRIKELKAQNKDLLHLQENYDQEVALARASALSESAELRVQLSHVDQPEAMLDPSPTTHVEGWEVVTNSEPVHADPEHEAAHVALAAMEPMPTIWERSSDREVSLLETLEECKLVAGEDFEFMMGGVGIKPVNGAGFAIDDKFPTAIARDAMTTEPGDLRDAKFEAHAALVRRHIEVIAKAGIFPYSFVPNAAFIEEAYAFDLDLAEDVRRLGIGILTPELATVLFNAVCAANHPIVVAEPVAFQTDSLVSHLEILGAKLKEATVALDDAVGSIKGQVQAHVPDVRRVELMPDMNIADRASGQ